MTTEVFTVSYQDGEKTGKYSVVSLPEGLTRDQIAAIFKKDNPTAVIKTITAGDNSDLFSGE